MCFTIVVCMSIVFKTSTVGLLVFNSINNLICCRLDKASDKQRDELSVSGIDDVVMILEADYKNAYFVTGTLMHL